jgi:hypothetical protein
MTQAQAHPATLDGEALLAQCDVHRGRAGGPGGQNRNKVETAIELTHRPTGVKGQASERRTQQLNMSKAVFRLRVNLALEVRRQIDPLAKPSDMWRSRVRGGVISLNPSHHDFPPMLAELLDTLHAVHADVQRTGLALGVSSSQIIKLLKHEPRALVWLNEQRTTKGLKPYK